MVQLICKSTPQRHCQHKMWTIRGHITNTKVLLQFFSSSLPICPIYFHLVMPRHLLSPCHAHYEHIGCIKGYVTYYLACYVRLHVQNMSYYMRLQVQNMSYYMKLQVQNMSYYMRLQVQNMHGYHLRKYGWGQTGRFEEKIIGVLLY